MENTEARVQSQGNQYETHSGQIGHGIDASVSSSYNSTNAPYKHL